MLSSLLENLAALHLNLKWTKSPASDIGTKKTFHSHYCKSAFFKRQSRSTRPSCLHAAGSLNIPSVCERDWATRAMWRRHIGALRKRRGGFFSNFFFPLLVSPGWSFCSAPSPGELERRFSRRLSARPDSLPFQLCKHRRPLPRPNTAVCLPDKFVFVLFLFLIWRLSAALSYTKMGSRLPPVGASIHAGPEGPQSRSSELPMFPRTIN